MPMYLYSAVWLASARTDFKLNLSHGLVHEHTCELPVDARSARHQATEFIIVCCIAALGSLPVAALVVVLPLTVHRIAVSV